MSWQISLEKNLHGKRIFSECVALFDEISTHFGKSAVIVDCGCGRGGLLSLLKQAGYGNVVGYDMSQERVLISRSFGLNVFEWDITLLPLWDNVADCVVYEESLEYLEEVKYQSSLKESSRVLKPGGLLIIASLTFGDAPPLPNTYYERSLQKDEIMSLLPNFQYIQEKTVARSSKKPCLVLTLRKGKD